MLAEGPLFKGFVRRTQITGTLRCETALRIGAGKTFDALTSDLPVLRSASGQPVIPGSSIKGVIRSQVEALLRSYALPVCDPLSEPCLGGKEDYQLKVRETAASRAEERRADIAARVCHACRLFGGLGLASHVIFSDAVPAEGTQPVVEVRDGVAIDRDLMRAADKRKFDFEVVAAGSAFTLRLTLHDLDLAGEGAVLQGLNMLEEGFARLGGFKSRGLGQVTLQEVRVKQLLFEGGLKTVEHGDWPGFRDERVNAFLSFCQKHRGGG